MNGGEGCWSTVICTPAERAALGVSDWMLQCRLGAGHRGNHATDASDRPRSDRRLWLEWNDFDSQAQSLIERNSCTARTHRGAPCLYFEGHGGPHRFAVSNGHAPTAVGAGRPGPTPQPGTVTHPMPGGPSQPVPPPQAPMTAEANIVDPLAAVENQSPPSAGSHYRGGRRSTDSEPPLRRHAALAASPPPWPGGGAHSHAGEGSLATRHRMADALSDVASSLQRLADIMRTDDE